MPDTLRIGIVGCGGAAQIMYAPVLRFVERAQVTALCDPFPAASEAMQDLLRVDLERFVDYDEFLRRAPVDAVLISTPVFLHREQVIKAARAGKHILCEKPMAATLPECDEMIAAARDAGVVFTIGFMKRFDKSLRHAKHLIDSGRLGTIDQALIEWRGGMPTIGRTDLSPTRGGGNWRPRLETLGGAYQDLGSHTTDVSRWWLGDITQVSVEFSMVGAQQFVDNSAVAVYQHTSGARSVHLLGFGRRPPTELYLFDGTDAALEVHFGPGAGWMSSDPFRMTLYEDNGRRAIDETQYPHTVIDRELATSGRYKREIDAFRDAILDGAPLVVTPQDGRATMEAINAGYLSAYSGRKIALPLTEQPDLATIFTEMKARVGR
ncbi:MAG: Gfo/Idh/MocA family oxidoreductase [Chloroflexi bacterium]|nr:Gfo/Idh/MocA family oxidoreductase [Chloroflexota bacterium]